METVPVVLLRLLRLVRVFRLAQALPRLRAIIEALISGFGAVKWVMLLIFTFNYVSGEFHVIYIHEMCTPVAVIEWEFDAYDTDASDDHQSGDDACQPQTHLALIQTMGDNPRTHL